MRLAFVRAFVLGCGLLVTCELAHATAISFSLGNNTGGLDEVIASLTPSTGLQLRGNPSDHPNLVVAVSSSQILLATAGGNSGLFANPPAGIAIGNFPLTNAAFTMANGDVYSDLLINPFVGGNMGNCPNCVLGAPATISVLPTDANGNFQPVEEFTYTLTTGNNFVTIQANPGFFIAQTTIQFSGGISSLGQPRISGPFGIGLTPDLTEEAAEPATLSLLGFGLAAFGLCFRKIAKTL